MSGQYNLRNPAVKRLMKEAQELREPTEQYFAQPLEDNLFEWHFTIRGPADSEFDGGIYHGRITLPPEYPMKPPSIMLLTPNGRFETFKKICLSISGHHPESWQPSWSIRTALLAIIGFMPTHGNGAIGSLDYTAEERKVLSKRSLEWKCSECGSMKTLLKPVTEASKKTTEEAKELASQINFQGEKEKNGSTKGGEGSAAAATTTATSTAPSTTTETPGATGGAASTPRPPLIPGAPFNQAMFPPNFPTTMPNASMPSFMPRMMTPSEAGGAMPPFPRPFWPGMMPTMPGNGSMPARPPGGMMYPWPPMFNPMMMNAQMMAMMNQQMRMPTMTAPAGTAPSPPSSSLPSTPQPATSTSTVTSSSQSATSRTSTVTTTTTATPSTFSSTGTASSTPASQPAATSPPSSTVNSSPPATTASGTNAASATTTSSTTTPTSSSTPGTASTSSASAAASASTAPTTTADAGLRQRTATRPPAPVAPPTYGAAELAAQSVRRGENPVVVMVMALLGLLIIALILRRLYYVVNAAAFDNDF